MQCWIWSPSSCQLECLSHSFLFFFVIFIWTAPETKKSPKTSTSKQKLSDWKAIQDISRFSARATKMKTNRILSQFLCSPWNCFLSSVQPHQSPYSDKMKVPTMTWINSAASISCILSCFPWWKLFYAAVAWKGLFSRLWKNEKKSLGAFVYVWSSSSVFLPQHTAIYAAVSCCSVTALLFTLDQRSPRTHGALLERCQEVNTAGRAINTGALDHGQEQANSKEHNNAGVNKRIF